MANTPNSGQNQVMSLDDALKASLEELDERINGDLQAPTPPTGTSGGRATPVNGASGDATPPANGAGQEGVTVTPPASETQQYEEIPIPGVSAAYGFTFDGLKPKENNPKKKTSEWSNSPEKKDVKVKPPSGKTISEMIWNELLSFYEWVIDSSVDLVLDFTTFVLYPKKPNSSEEEKEEPKDVIAKGCAAHESWKDDQLKNKELVLAMHNELFENLRRQKIGAPLVWNNIGEKPAFFDNLFTIYTEAEADPRSESAKIMKRLKKFPDLLNTMFDNSAKVGKLAYNYATLQEYIKPSKKSKQEPHINENAQKYYNTFSANINKIRAAYRDNPQEMDNVIQRYALGIKDSLSNLQGCVMSFYENDKKIKKKNRAQFTPQLNAVESAIHDFEISVREENGTEMVSKKLSEIAAPESGNIRLPELLIHEGTPDNVQQEQRQRGQDDFIKLWQAYLTASTQCQARRA